jgi:hypothetical protein
MEQNFRRKRTTGFAGLTGYFPKKKAFFFGKSILNPVNLVNPV